MAEQLPGLDALTQDQKDRVLQLIQEAKDKAVNEAKQDFRAGVAGCKRPEPYSPEKESIQDFFDSFEAFRNAAQLQGQVAISSFLTYIDNDSRSTLVEQNLKELTDWEQFKNHAIVALSAPKDRVRTRFRLRNAVQQTGESVADFGKRLIKLGRIGYAADEEIVKDRALKDALAAGVERNELGILLINEDNKNFSELLSLAINYDASFKARQVIRGETNVEVPIMKTEQVNIQQNQSAGSTHYYPPNTNYQQHITPAQYCNYCGQMEHLAKACPGIYRGF